MPWEIPLRRTFPKRLMCTPLHHLSDWERNREALAVYRLLVPDVSPRRKRDEMANNRAPETPMEMSKNVDGSGTNVACT